MKRRSLAGFVAAALACGGCIEDVMLGEEFLVARWSLDDGRGGLAKDAADHRLDGVLCNHPTELERCTGIEGPAWDFGRFAGGLAFDGIDDGVRVPYQPDLDLAEITLEAWIRWSGANDWQQRILERSRAGSGGTQSEYSLTIAADGQVQVEVRLGPMPGDTLFAATNQRVAKDIWTHIAATYEGTDAVIYLDGIKAGAARGGGPILFGGPEAERGLGIGNQIDRNRPFLGIIDEVRIYRLALGEDLVRARYTALR